jgi:hypothetical protein
MPYGESFTQVLRLTDLPNNIFSMFTLFKPIPPFRTMNLQIFVLRFRSSDVRLLPEGGKARVARQQVQGTRSGQHDDKERTRRRRTNN